MKMGMKLSSLSGTALTLSGAAPPCCRERVQKEGKEERKKERKKEIEPTVKKKKKGFLYFPPHQTLKTLNCVYVSGSTESGRAIMNANSFKE